MKTNDLFDLSESDKQMVMDLAVRVECHLGGDPIRVKDNRHVFSYVLLEAGFTDSQIYSFLKYSDRTGPRYAARALDKKPELKQKAQQILNASLGCSLSPDSPPGSDRGAPVITQRHRAPASPDLNENVSRENMVSNTGAGVIDAPHSAAPTAKSRGTGRQDGGADRLPTCPDPTDTILNHWADGKQIDFISKSCGVSEEFVAGVVGV
ncbi:MAG: hypothetical protein AAF564_22240 [Bacteroidota bacterium]